MCHFSNVDRVLNGRVRGIALRAFAWLAVPVVGLVVAFMGGSAISTPLAAQVTTISAAPNPCSGNANTSGETIPVWTLTGNVCISLATYNSQPAGSWNIACPNGGIFLGVWVCNTGPRPQFSAQYFQCLETGLWQTGRCDTSGLAQDIASGLVRWESYISIAAAIGDIVVNHKPGIQTICDGAAFTGLSSSALIGLLGTAVDTVCAFIGTDTPPTVAAWVQSKLGFAVAINGYMASTTVGATLGPALVCFGDASPCVYSYFPVSHEYSGPGGTYSVSVTAIDSNGLGATTNLGISIQATPGTPPTIEVFPCSVTGRTATCNGVAMPKAPATITQIEWCFGDGTCTLSWFPATHTFPTTGGAFNVTATATDSNNLTASASVEVNISAAQSGAPSLNSITVTPATISPGQTAALTISLSGSAPAGGASVSLTSSAPLVFPVPSTVLISAGATSVSIPVTLATSAGAGSSVVTATYSGKTVQAQLFFE